jgi:AmiR/NasT family two-component response regulator
MVRDEATTPPLQIVIVEDEILLALDLESHLTALGHEVIGIASDSEQSFPLPAATAPNLVLVDLDLRDGLTGLNVPRS